MIRKFFQHVMPGVIRPLHALWNEVIAFLFLCFAALAGAYVVKAARAFDGTFEGVGRIAVPGLFALVMAYFSLSSYFRARKISRS